MSTGETARAWVRLIAGERLDSLGLPRKDGRIMLHDFAVPDPVLVREHVTDSAKIDELAGLTVVRGKEWRSLDFTGSRLRSLRFYNCLVEDCVFDSCDCADWRLWGSSIRNTRFRSTNLRGSALGSVTDGIRNTFDGVEFTGTDLRGTVYQSAAFVRCVFTRARLNKVDFNGSVFENCRFEGELREVIFNRAMVNSPVLSPNEMSDVDLRKARLRFVEFRSLDMARVQWPEDDEHLLVYNYVAALDRVLSVLATKDDGDSKALAAFLGVYRKWAGSAQRQGVLNTRDIREIAGDAALEDVLRILSEFAARPGAGPLLGSSRDDG